MIGHGESNRLPGLDCRIEERKRQDGRRLLTFPPSDILHPNRANIAKDELREKLAGLYKATKDQVSVFGLRTQFGGGKTTGFGLVYDSPEAMKKFEPQYRLVRVGLATKPERASRQQRASSPFYPVYSVRCRSDAGLVLVRDGYADNPNRQAAQEQAKDAPRHREEQGQEGEEGVNDDLSLVRTPPTHTHPPLSHSTNIPDGSWWMRPGRLYRTYTCSSPVRGGISCGDCALRKSTQQSEDVSRRSRGAEKQGEKKGGERILKGNGCSCFSFLLPFLFKVSRVLTTARGWEHGNESVFSFNLISRRGIKFAWNQGCYGWLMCCVLGLRVLQCDWGNCVCIFADRQRVSGVYLTGQERKQRSAPTLSGIQPQMTTTARPTHDPALDHQSNHRSYHPNHTRPRPYPPPPTSHPLTPRLPHPRNRNMPPTMRNRRVPRLASKVRRLPELHRLLAPALRLRDVRRPGPLREGIEWLCEVEPELGGAGGLAFWFFVLVLGAEVEVGVLGWCWGWCWC